MLELADDEFLPALLVCAAEIAQHRGEFVRRGVLERVDRLLLVADREHGAPDAARAGAGGEFGREPAHDLPLLVAGVLRLIDQHMVDAEVELVVHPGGIDVAQQLQRLVDEIVVIKQPAALFLAGVARQHIVGDGEQRFAAAAAGDGALPFHERADAALLGAEPFDQCRIGDRLRHDGFARRARAGKENVEIALDPFGAGKRRQACEAGGLLAVALAALRQDFRQRRPFLRCDDGAGEIVRLDLFQAVGRIDAECLRQLRDRRSNPARPRHPLIDHVAVADGLAHHVTKRLVGRGGHGDGERAGERAVRRGGAVEQHAERQPLEQLRLLGVVEHAEAGGDVGLERELVQEQGAEGVDGLHLETARRFERAGEQPARQRAPRRRRRAVGMLGNGVVERGVVERGPGRQAVEHLLCHIGRGRLGEGDAENFFRRDAFEQKVDHALRQHISLAGAGIGGDPGRHSGIGGFALPLPHLARDGVRRSHSPPQMSSISPPVADHSLTRARWS